MKVLMVGHSGAGKTSFMAGLYKRLGDENSGYGMYAVDRRQHVQLQRLATALSQGIYPAGTDVQSSYSFKFTRNGKAVMPIEWIDYRGGALTSADENDEEQQQLAADISSSDALIVFLDGTKMERMTWETRCEFDVIMTCIDMALNKPRAAWLPVSLVITKSDLITVDNSRLQGLTYFNNFLENAENSDVLRVSLNRCMVNKKEDKSTLYPFLFAMDGMLPNYIASCKKEEEIRLNYYHNVRPGNIFMVLLSIIEQLIEWIFILISYVLKMLLKLLKIDMKLWNWNTSLKQTLQARRAWKEMMRNRKNAEKRVKKVDKDIRKYIKKKKIIIYGK